jgi:hypothetical protein
MLAIILLNHLKPVYNSLIKKLTRHLMKITFSIFALILSFSVFAQDGYHSEVYNECLPGDNCLINLQSDFMIKTIPDEDYDGVVVGEKLSSSSMISDTLHARASYCYQGDAQGVCNLLNLMAYDDGHATIRHFECRPVEGKVDIRYSVEYDMGPGIENYAFLLGKCQ